MVQNPFSSNEYTGKFVHREHAILCALSALRFTIIPFRVHNDFVTIELFAKIGWVYLENTIENDLTIKIKQSALRHSGTESRIYVKEYYSVFTMCILKYILFYS